VNAVEVFERRAVDTLLAPHGVASSEHLRHGLVRVNDIADLGIVHQGARVVVGDPPHDTRLRTN
jgi:hypothetical protein